MIPSKPVLIASCPGLLFPFVYFSRLLISLWGPVIGFSLHKLLVYGIRTRQWHKETYTRLLPRCYV
jgi:hypothetical protein